MDVQGALVHFSEAFVNGSTPASMQYHAYTATLGLLFVSLYTLDCHDPL